MFNLLMLQDTSTEAAQTSFGPMQALEEGGPVSWTIAGILVIMSVVSWYIMATKLFEQGKVLKDSTDGVKKFWSAGSLRDGAAKFDKNSAYRQLVEDGIAASDQHGKLTDPIDQHTWLDGALGRSQQAILNKLNGGLSFLATVGSTSPFVGLLGTVIGITSALVKIAATGQADIANIAGPVGEALYMTAFGLIVAVPAVIGYNWLQGRNKQIAKRMGEFATDMHNYMTSSGALKPTVSAPAPAAKPAAAKPTIAKA